MATKKPEIRQPDGKYLLPKAVRCMEMIANDRSKVEICTILRISPRFYDRVYRECGFSERAVRARHCDSLGISPDELTEEEL